MAIKTLPVTILLFSSEQDFAIQYIPADTFLVLSNTDQLKQAKKLIRSKSPALVIGDLRNGEHTEAFLQLATHTKEKLKFEECQFVAILDSNHVEYDADVQTNLYIDEIFDTAIQNPFLIQQRLIKLAVFIQAMTQSLKQSDAQSALLMSVTRFAHHRQPIEKLIRCVAVALAEFSSAHASSIIYHEHVEMQSQQSPDEYQSIDTPNWMLTIAEQGRQCTMPKIQLLEECQTTKMLSEALGNDISSCILFPLRVYGENLATIACFIDDNAMRLVTTQHLNVMRDVSDQLRLVLEQRSAESRLEAQYQRLKATMEELQTTKEQLIHSEKMASVGKMAAGIAHEINNPLSFVLGNFDPLNEYVDTLVTMLEMHDKFMDAMTPDPQSAVLRHQINSFKADSELEYVMEDIQAIVNDSRDGLLRVRDIISDLSSFSHKQDLETQQTVVRNVVDEALRLLKYEIPAEVTVSNLLDSNIVLRCHRGFIQQIITNLVKNASQALISAHHSQPKNVTISGEQQNEFFVIKVEDNGPGIPETQLSKIFDPFFTTKEIGKGTGLGLSVCFNLAKKMGGNLSVESSPQEYTCFSLQLPN